MLQFLASTEPAQSAAAAALKQQAIPEAAIALADRGVASEAGLGPGLSIAGDAYEGDLWAKVLLSCDGSLQRSCP